MASELPEGEMRQKMYAELIGEEVDYTAFALFILDDQPLNERNRAFCFPSSSLPACEIANLTFKIED